MSTVESTFGPWLRQKLLERRITLARLCREAKCDYTYLWRIINAENASGRKYLRPSYQLTLRIGEALDAPREALFAAGYGNFTELDQARTADRMSRLEADVQRLRESLEPVAISREPAARRLPRLGQVSAGELEEALGSPEGWEVMPDSICHGADFVLTVRGESMHPTLQEGDLVCVRQSPSATPGEVVVATGDGSDFTIKRYEVQDGVPVLMPDNPSWQPIRFRPGLRVVGVVTGSLRPPQVLNRRPR